MEIEKMNEEKMQKELNDNLKKLKMKLQKQLKEAKRIRDNKININNHLRSILNINT